MHRLTEERTQTPSTRRASAIIVVDPQPDFLEGGALPVRGATDTCDRITNFLDESGDDFDLRVVTQDWHVDPASHWSN